MNFYRCTSCMNHCRDFLLSRAVEYSRGYCRYVRRNSRALFKVLTLPSKFSVCPPNTPGVNRDLYRIPTSPIILFYPPHRFRVQVCAPLYPKAKTEAWWVVVGDKKNNTLLAIKRVTLQRKTRAKLEFAAPDEVGLVFFDAFACVYSPTWPHADTGSFSGQMLGTRRYFQRVLCDLNVSYVSCAVSQALFVQGDRALYPRSGSGTTTAVVAFFFLHLRGWWCCMVVRAKGRLGCVIVIPIMFYVFGDLTSPSDRQVTIRETQCLCFERNVVGNSFFFFLLGAVPAGCFPSLSHGSVCHAFLACVSGCLVFYPNFLVQRG